MKVLLLGATGNLGVRCIQALLAHKHDVTLYVRNPAKLRMMVSPAVTSHVTIVVGDALDSAEIKKAILDHDIAGIVNVAGNQVAPWKEPILPKIARAVTEAAVAVGRERKIPLRAWLVTGVNVLRYPGTTELLNDHMGTLSIGVAAHIGTRDVVEAVPLSDLRWSLIAVGMMYPKKPRQTVFDLLEAPLLHNLVLEANSAPGWEDTWLKNIPWIGLSLNMLINVLRSYGTYYEDVADVLASDLASGSEEWMGAKVGMKDKSKMKSV